MKKQIDIGSGNEQISDDDTIQIQIGWSPIIVVLVGLLLIGLLWYK
jgi:hypothetical protein